MGPPPRSSWPREVPRRVTRSRHHRLSARAICSTCSFTGSRLKLRDSSRGVGCTCSFVAIVFSVETVALESVTPLPIALLAHADTGVPYGEQNEWLNLLRNWSSVYLSKLTVVGVGSRSSPIGGNMGFELLTSN